MAWEGAIAVTIAVEVVYSQNSSNQKFWEVSLVGSLTLPRKLNVKSQGRTFGWPGGLFEDTGIIHGLYI